VHETFVAEYNMFYFFVHTLLINLLHILNYSKVQKSSGKNKVEKNEKV